MNIHANRIHPFSYFGMCLLTIPLIVVFSYFMYLDIRLDFFHTKEISANIVNWEIKYSKHNVNYLVHYEFAIHESKPVIITGSGGLAHQEFENSKLYPHIQIEYSVSNPDINRPIKKNKNTSKYIGSIFIILISFPIAIIGIVGLFIFPFTSKESIQIK